MVILKKKVWVCPHTYDSSCFKLKTQHAIYSSDSTDFTYIKDMPKRSIYKCYICGEETIVWE